MNTLAVQGYRSFYRDRGRGERELRNMEKFSYLWERFAGNKNTARFEMLDVVNITTKSFNRES